MSTPNMMIYRDTKIDVNFQVTCAACPPFLLTDDGVEANNETIQMYPTMTHAVDAGWVATKDRLFCEPLEDFAWVCPDCAAGFEWGRK